MASLKQKRTLEFTHEDFDLVFSVDYHRPNADLAYQIEHSFAKILEADKAERPAAQDHVRDTCAGIAGQVLAIRADGADLLFEDDRHWGEMSEQERVAVIVDNYDVFMWSLARVMTLGAGKTQLKKSSAQLSGQTENIQ